MRLNPTRTNGIPFNENWVHVSLELYYRYYITSPAILLGDLFGDVAGRVTIVGLNPITGEIHTLEVNPPQVITRIDRKEARRILGSEKVNEMRRFALKYMLQAKEEIAKYPDL